MDKKNPISEISDPDFDAIDFSDDELLNEDLDDDSFLDDDSLLFLGGAPKTPVKLAPNDLSNQEVVTKITARISEMEGRLDKIEKILVLLTKSVSALNKNGRKV